ncbi:MAG: rRNA maturation RNase YbeY [Candidatus Cloacimonetes bacterium]|nr:rRNA maturation RNase YbeY [Candidatus Cloacimonadota bacterium]
MNNIDLIDESGYPINTNIFQETLDILIIHNLFDEKKTLCLKLINEGKIKIFNKKYRGKDKETDVLTFMSEFYETGFLGDMLIDVSVADNQKDSHSLKDELLLLFVHGLLHLQGFDHIKSSDKIEMKLKETQIYDLLYKEKMISWKI